MPAPTARILAVCTGNICRSPAIERLLAAALVGTGIEVRSAGTRAVVGHPINGPMVALVQGAGASADGFAARQLTADLLAGQDLVIAATRAHRAAVVELAPALVQRTVTLLSLTRLGPLAGDDPAARLRAVPAALALARVSGPVDDDVVDPIGRSAAVYRRSFDQVRAGVDALVAALMLEP